MAQVRTRKRGKTYSYIFKAGKVDVAAVIMPCVLREINQLESRRLFKVPKNAPKNIIKRTIITPEQFAALLEKYPFGTPLYMPLLLLYHTGMRLGEVLGLMWQDIDFAARQIKTLAVSTSRQ